MKEFLRKSKILVALIILFSAVPFFVIYMIFKTVVVLLQALSDIVVGVRPNMKIYLNDLKDEFRW